MKLKVFKPYNVFIFIFVQAKRERNLKLNKMEITKFETGNIYEMRFIGDYDLSVKFICIKLTKTLATFQKFQGTEVIKKKIKVHNSVQYILTADYSCAPVIKANRIVG